MGIFVFELGKVPDEIDASNLLELFLHAFRADTEEDLEILEKLGVPEMNEMITAYREITTSPDYVDLERKRVMSRLDEGQALSNARRKGFAEGEESANSKWQVERKSMADEIARLRAQLGE
ncbi:MAG: hypothetical protein LBS51_02015 [Oscillospiraceae bacterium]|jgi:hypothetical protein|nr:hypothetical protein [Oscillospiraceae bacterium]